MLVCLAESLPADTKPVTSSLHQAESGIKGAAADEVDVKHHVKKRERKKRGSLNGRSDAIGNTETLS